MCDGDIHQGLVEDWSLSRRTFVATGLAAVGLSTSAYAAAGIVENDVTVRTPDGVADAALFHPSGKGPWPAALIWPDIQGLRPVMRDISRRLAAEGYVVLVPNPFYRAKRAPITEGPVDFNNPDQRAKLLAMRQAITDDMIDRDAGAFVAFLDAQQQTDKRKKAGVQGYCMGGLMSFRTAALLPDRIGAVASFHGGGLVTKEPSSPHLLIPRTRAAYLVAVARNDDQKEPDAKTVLRKAFEEAHRPATVEVYPADHGWCVPGNQVYDQTAAERAWGELIRLYKASLV